VAELRVLVVGAGIAGLATARALRRHGITVEVVERSPEWHPTGAGLYLPANAVRGLAALGVPVTERAHPVRRQRLVDHRGRRLADIPVSAIWNGVDDCRAIHRADLHRILLDAVPEVPLRLGVAVTGVRDGDHPTVTLATPTGESTEAYHLIVGADGVRSTMRARLGGPAPRPVGQVCWRFVVDHRPDITDWTARLGPGRTFLTVALGGGRVYCYADVSGLRADAGREGWRRHFADFADPVPALLEQAAGAHHAVIEEVSPPVWSGHRVVLVGDAAHASSPNMAQGAAMAVEDALVLADLLADVTSWGSSRPSALTTAIEEYERRRAPRVDWVQEQTHRRDRTRELPPMVRNLVLRAAATRIFAAGHRPLHAQP
jgi:2-polyprenyl-6-methoxyphenol hydroxylase-like FAD-dependent oxidoreductase